MDRDTRVRRTLEWSRLTWHAADSARDHAALRLMPDVRRNSREAHVSRKNKSASEVPDDSGDCDLSRDEYFAERKLLLEARQRGYQRAEQMVMGGATGALVLSITFLEKLVPVATVSRAGLLVSAWAVLIVSLCFSLIGQYVSAGSFTAELRRLDFSVSGKAATPNRLAWWNTVVGVAAAALLALGISLLAWFAYINAPFKR